MKHLDLAFEKLHDLIDELYWTDIRYERVCRELPPSKLQKHLLETQQRYSETCLHLIALCQKYKHPYRAFEIHDAQVDAPWETLTSKGKTLSNLMKYCRVQDKRNLKLLKKLIDDGWLPTSLLSTLVTIEFELQQRLETRKKLEAKHDSNAHSAASRLLKTLGFLKTSRSHR